MKLSKEGSPESGERGWEFGLAADNPLWLRSSDRRATDVKLSLREGLDIIRVNAFQ